MTRDITAAFAEALADQHLRPVIFFEGEFATGWVRIWSGLGEISWNGVSWSGAGALYFEGEKAIDANGVGIGRWAGKAHVEKRLCAMA